MMERWKYGKEDAIHDRCLRKYTRTPVICCNILHADDFLLLCSVVLELPIALSERVWGPPQGLVPPEPMAASVRGAAGRPVND
ncbi:hypothetical protein NHX12_010149 [Muraenolepis orangiensis]|uniref:Uncharacterized protein n=1 Tax=Muraenolepis orangiensis TaxID=630683 RepID=A0A9Q0DJ10_9TELE|nr:hypothetical protein NHX12_010149 [Muraenolepis orangiensis]